MNTVATPGSLVADTVPPCRSTMALTIERPRPLRTAGFAGARRIDLVEPVEDEREVLGRNAPAGIAHRQGDRIPGQLRANLDFSAGRRVPQGVGGEILQRLLEAERVAVEDFRAGADGRRHRDAFQFRFGFVTGGDPADEVFHRDVARDQRFAAGFETRQIEQVADELLETLGFVGDDAEAVAVLGIRAPGRSSTALRGTRGSRSAASSARATRRRAAGGGCGPRP